mgnify:CR=1 FL=1
MSKTIGIIGTRSRNSFADFDLTRKAFDTIYEDGDTLVSGGCPQGGDRFAELIAKDRKIPAYYVPEGSAELKEGYLNIHPAFWNKYGRRAGFIRNAYIARDAEVLMAVVSPARTGGTEDTIAKYLKVGKDRVILV